jgi:hypothetical protein
VKRVRINDMKIVVMARGAIVSTSRDNLTLAGWRPGHGAWSLSCRCLCMSRVDVIINVFQIVVFTSTRKSCLQWLKDNPEKRDGYDVIMSENLLIVTVFDYLDNFAENDGESVTLKHRGEIAWWWRDTLRR